MSSFYIICVISVVYSCENIKKQNEKENAFEKKVSLQNTKRFRNYAFFDHKKIQ